MEIFVDRASKKFGNTKVLSEISLKLYGGLVYGFQGINGCGKTMLMRLIAGLIYPTEGSVIVDGKRLGDEYSFPPSMGLLLENPAFLPNYSGIENLQMLAEISQKTERQKISDALDRVGLGDEDRHKKYRKYSLGMRQRLGIACAIMECPDLLILDEPFISLDIDGIERTIKIIEEEKKRGALIILACHDLETMSVCADEIFKLTAGTITKHLVKNASGVFCEVVT